jgi:hypothetical protein
VKTEETEPAIEAIVAAARTGEVGDGKIFVYRSRRRSASARRARRAGAVIRSRKVYAIPGNEVGPLLWQASGLTTGLATGGGTLE